MLHYRLLLLTLLACITYGSAAGYQGDSEVDSKPVTANFAIPNAIHLDSKRTVTISSPRGAEGVQFQEAIHSPTTGEMETVSVSSGEGVEEGGVTV